jgi:hypothetical protein
VIQETPVQIRPQQVLAAIAVTAIAATADAQGGALASQCAAPAYTPGTIPTLAQVRQDACQKAVDLFAFMAPQLGTSITGGNAVLGSASTLGGPGRFSVGLRANVIAGQLPQTTNVQLSATGARAGDFAPQDQILGLPAAEAAIGLFKGLPVGMTNVGGLDLLVSAFYVPEVEEGDFSLSTSGGAVKFGYGARLGILQETAVVPGVSVSYLRRDLPTVNLAARVAGGDSVMVRDLETQTSAWRLVAGKRFAVVGLAAGVGQDTYDSGARAEAYLAPRQIIPGLNTPAVIGEVARPSQKLTRTNYFADLALNLGVVRLVGEIGRVSGGSVPATFNAFGGRGPGDAYTYGSFGIRLAR